MSIHAPKTRLPSSENGSVFPLVLILMALLSMVAFGFGDVLSSHRDDVRRTNQRLSSKYIAKYLENYLKRPTVWNATRAHSMNAATMSCLGTPNGCGQTERIIRVLTNTAGAVIFDRENRTHGFTAAGVPCGTAGTPGCPYRLKLSLAPNCPPAPAACPAPTTGLRGEIEVVGSSTDSTGAKLNSANSKFVIPL